MQQIIIDIMNHCGYFGILFLITVENIFPPIPSEVILPFGGFMTTYSNMSILGVIVTATLGSYIGAIILYLVGYLINADKLEQLLSGKIGKALHFKKGDVKKAETWFNNKGKATVFFCRFIPIVRSLISIPAGMAKMHFIPFSLLTILGSLIWNTVLISLGAAAGNSWEKIEVYISDYSHIVLIALVLLIIGFIVYRIKYKKVVISKFDTKKSS